jgi:hypothetical protein
MNQQAGPSIVLSVLIVAFFAVALFPREPARPQTGSLAGPIEPRSKSNSPSTSGLAPSSLPVATTVRRGDAGGNPSLKDVRIPPRADHPTEDANDLTQQRESVHASQSPTAVSLRESRRRSTEGPSPLPGPESAGPTIRTASQRASRADPDTVSPMAGAVPLTSTGSPRQPRRAVTAVAANETISDIARRVYGTTDAIDTLWRANRDTLPRRDSPLSPGTLLRTPTIR